MKKTIIGILVLSALNSYAQPKKATPETGGFKDTTVKQNVWLVVADKEGYLQRIKGYAMTTYFINADATITKQPLQKLFKESGEAVKPEDFHDVKQRQ